MLKKFLKFLKGASTEREFDGSYLEHLLEQATPRLQAQLAECPEHDPLLLVIVEILRLTKPDYWSDQIACPLADEQSPPLSSSAPAPPPPKPPESAETLEPISEGFEIVEAEDVADYTAEDAPPELPTGDEEPEAPVDEEPEAPAVEDDEAQADDQDSETSDDQDSETADDQDSETADDEDGETADDEDGETADDEESDSHAADEATNGPDDEDEAEEAPAAEASDDKDIADDEAEEGPADIAYEEPADVIDEVSEAIEEAIEDEPAGEAAVGDARLDTPEVLQAGRIFLGLLIENDRLPLDMQLSVVETMLARDLLLGYFVNDEAFDDRAQELLALVEQKFNDGAFSQARILLQLFQTDRATRINNDRNLFYEDMILRLGIRRRHVVDASLLDEFEDDADGDDLDESLPRATGWLEQNLHVVFHLFTRQREEVDRWRALAECSRRERAEQVFLRYVPPKRWRPIHALQAAPSELVTTHVSAATIKRYVQRQLKACYFVLRAVGDTGLEPYLDVFFDWTQRCFDLNSVRLMPLIYRQTMSDDQLIDTIFEEIFRNFFRRRAAEYLDDFDDETILEAARETLDALSGLDFNQIPPGEYDFGGLLLDRLFGVEYHEPEFAFKLHRLT